MTINIDSVLFTLLMSVLFLFFFLRTARKATAGVPGKFQSFVEMVVGFVDGLVRETFHGTQQADRAAGAHHLLPGVPDEFHGHDPGRLAAGRLGQGQRSWRP